MLPQLGSALSDSVEAVVNDLKSRIEDAGYLLDDDVEQLFLSAARPCTAAFALWLTSDDPDAARREGLAASRVFGRLASRNDAPLDQVLKRCLRWHDAVAAQLGKDALRLGADDVLPEALARLQRSLNVTLVRMSQAFEVDRLAERRALAAHQEQIVFQANHDALTGLPNRALIMDRIDALLARSRRSETVPAALFIDLDDFKNVNDTLGHDAGDRLLQAVAGRLKQALRGADTIGRMGGDEFVILIEGTSDSSRGEVVGERILEAMREPFHLDGSAVPIVVTTSAGIAIGHRSAPGDLLRDADVALYQAKAAGKNCWEVFGPEMESTLVGRYELDFSLRGALKNKEFSLVYQPIYSLDDLTLVGVEALIRWQHPTLGEIQPDRFVPLLESSGRILEVGRWVLREACVQMATWRARGSDLSVAVNVSGRQLDHDVLVEHVEEALETSGLEPAALTVEITETALMRNVDATAQRLTELKRRGVQLAIDDFGTGYSSLAYLQRFPVDSLKIDRAFTNAMTRSPESDALIHTFIQLGKDLGLKTLAEGVEHIGQIDRLRAEEVNEAQGFLFARPLDPAALEAQILEPARMISAVRGASAS